MKSDNIIKEEEQDRITYVKMMEVLGYDIELTYVKRESQ